MMITNHLSLLATVMEGIFTKSKCQTFCGYSFIRSNLKWKFWHLGSCDWDFSLKTLMINILIDQLLILKNNQQLNCS